MSLKKGQRETQTDRPLVGPLAPRTGYERLGASSRYHAPPPASFREQPSPSYSPDLRPLSPSDARHELSRICRGFGTHPAGRHAVDETPPPHFPCPQFFLQTRSGTREVPDLNLPVARSFRFSAVAVEKDGALGWPRGQVSVEKHLTGTGRAPRCLHPGGCSGIHLKG